MLTGVSLACCFYGYAPDQRVEFFDEREAALRWLGVDAGSSV